MMKWKAGGSAVPVQSRWCRGGWWRCRASLQAFDVVGGKEGAHLGDGDFVRLEEAFGLGQSLADEDGVEALKIGEDDKLLQRGVVAEVALGVGMGVAPLFCGLGLGDGWRDERLLDRVGVDAVVDLGH